MPGRLNRMAVLFRLFLLIPCGIVNNVVTYGALTIFQFVNWVIVLLKGRMPDTIYQALSAVLRYQLRVIGFAVMLTSAYPGELFGDAPAPAPQGYAAPQGYGAQPGYGDPLVPGGLPAYAGPRGYVADAGTMTGRPWPLILSAPARKLMVFFIVFGVIVSIGANILNAKLNGGFGGM
jgi:hypothetical protein